MTDIITNNLPTASLNNQPTDELVDNIIETPKIIRSSPGSKLNLGSVMPEIYTITEAATLITERRGKGFTKLTIKMPWILAEGALVKFLDSGITIAVARLKLSGHYEVDSATGMITARISLVNITLVPRIEINITVNSP